MGHHVAVYAHATWRTRMHVCTRVCAYAGVCARVCACMCGHMCMHVCACVISEIAPFSRFLLTH